jgi:hypothetical protein
MKTIVKLAAIALIAAPTFASAGAKTGAVMEADVFVDTTPVPAGSLGSGGAGIAIAIGVLTLAAVASSDGT